MQLQVKFPLDSLWQVEVLWSHLSQSEKCALNDYIIVFPTIIVATATICLIKICSLKFFTICTILTYVAYDSSDEFPCFEHIS